MKKEQIFEAVGEIEDRILERYRQMDVRLARKHAQKKRTLRVLAVAACLALLLGACVPVGMMIAQLAGDPSPNDPEIPGTSEELVTQDPGQESTTGPNEQETDPESQGTTSDPNDQTVEETQDQTTEDPGVTDPPQSQASISLRNMAALAEMREVIASEDEELLKEYLSSIEGSGITGKQDLLDFVALVDKIPYAWLIEGEVTLIEYLRSTNEGTGQADELLCVTVQATNGEWIEYEYHLSEQDELQFLIQAEHEIGDRNTLPVSVQSADARMELYLETREPHTSGKGETLTWWGVVDSEAVKITCYLTDTQNLLTWELIGAVSVSSLVNPGADTSADAQPRPSIWMDGHPFAWCDTEFGAYLPQPEMHVYAITGGAAPTLAGLEVDLVLECEPYMDDSVPPTVRASFDDREYVLSYSCSYPHSIRRQAVHCYVGESEIGSYTALIDQQTGACVSFQMEYAKIEIYTSMTDSKRRTYVQNYAKSHLSGDTDPSEYSYGGCEAGEKYSVYRISRILRQNRGTMLLETNDAVYVTLHNESNTVVGYESAFIGSMNRLEDMPGELYDAVYATLKEIAPAYFAQIPQGSTPLFPLVITADGRLAMDCTLPVEYYDEALQQTVTDSISLLFYLTEPIE